MKYDDHNIEKEVKKQYKTYQKHIIKKDYYIDGQKINRKRYPIIDHMCGTYFHMITKEKTTIPCIGEKSCITPDCTYYFKYNPLLNDPTLPRQICCDRVDSIPCIKDFFDKPIKIWKKQVVTKKGIRNRILCFDDSKDYLIILDEKNGNIKLWSGYPVRHYNRKKKLLKEYHNYINLTHKRHHTSKTG